MSDIDECDLSIYAESLAAEIMPKLKKHVMFHPLFLSKTKTWALAVGFATATHFLQSLNVETLTLLQVMFPKLNLLCFMDPHTYTNWDVSGEAVREMDAYSEMEFSIVR